MKERTKGFIKSVGFVALWGVGCAVIGALIAFVLFNLGLFKELFLELFLTVKQDYIFFITFVVGGTIALFAALTARGYFSDEGSL